MTPSSIRGCRPGGSSCFAKAPHGGPPRQGAGIIPDWRQPPHNDVQIGRNGRETRLGDWDEERERPLPVEVPHDELSAEALRGVVESFVLREARITRARRVP